jgi:hypothetical protein
VVVEEVVVVVVGGTVVVVVVEWGLQVGKCNVLFHIEVPSFVTTTCVFLQPSMSRQHCRTCMHQGEGGDTPQV